MKFSLIIKYNTVQLQLIPKLLFQCEFVCIMQKRNPYIYIQYVVFLLYATKNVVVVII